MYELRSTSTKKYDFKYRVCACLSSINICSHQPPTIPPRQQNLLKLSYLELKKKRKQWLLYPYVLPAVLSYNDWYTSRWELRQQNRSSIQWFKWCTVNLNIVNKTIWRYIITGLVACNRNFNVTKKKGIPRKKSKNGRASLLNRSVMLL